MTLKSDFRAANYMLGLVAANTKPRVFLEAYALTEADVSVLKNAAKQDAKCCIYNGCVSFLSGLASFHKQETVWAITKMYYSVFYLARASLCRSSFLIYHVPKDKSGYTQLTLKVSVGARSTVESQIPSTHKLVAARFRDNGYPSFMRGLQIDGLDPIEWIMLQREHWQYRCGRFPDPDFPDVLMNLDPKRIPRLLESYSSDATGAYLADGSHAVFSLPFRLLEWTLKAESLVEDGVIENDDIRFLERQCRIGRKHASVIARLLS